MHINLLAIPVIAASLLMLIIGMIIRSNASIPGVKYFSLLMFSGAVYSFFYALELSARELPLMEILYKLQYIGIPFIPTFFAVFAITYTQKSELRNSALVTALLGVSGITALLALTNDMHSLFIRELHVDNSGPFPVLLLTPGIWYWIHQIYSVSALLLGIILLFRMYISSASVFRKQTGIILAGSCIPFLAYILYLGGIFPRGLDPNPFAFALTGIIIFTGIFRFRLFSFAPLARNLLFDSIPDGVVVTDKFFRLVDINRSAMQLFGVGYGDIGRVSGEVFAKWPEITPKLTGVEKSGLFEISRITEDEFLFLDCVFSPLVDIHGTERGRMLVIHDVSKQKRAEIDREKSEEKFGIIYENAPVGLMYFDKNGMVELCNDYFLRIIGSERDKLTGMNLWQLSDARITELLKRVFGGQKAAFEGKYTTEISGREVFVKGAFKPLINRRNEVEGGLCIIEDISARKAAEDRIREANEELKHLNAEKDRFFSILAHDLRSPFTAFLGFTGILEESIDTMSTESVKAIASSMKESANNLYGLLENLLQWSRMQQGVVDFKPSEFPLQESILHCIEPLLVYANNKLIDVSYDIPVDYTVFADPRMFDSIVRNLFTNAVKFTPRHGSITISASKPGSQMVEICFSDTGIGMNNKTIEDLFRVDVKTSRAGTDGELSTGLGLILVREFIEMNGGSIRVESEEGKGSRFYVRLKEIGRD